MEEKRKDCENTKKQNYAYQGLQKLGKLSQKTQSGTGTQNDGVADFQS